MRRLEPGITSQTTKWYTTKPLFSYVKGLHIYIYIFQVKKSSTEIETEAENFDF